MRACLHLCILASLCVPLRAEVIDRVLAVVGGTPITLSDVIAAAELGLVTPPEGGDHVRGVLAKLIDRELQLAEVDRYAPPEPSAAEIDQELQSVRSRFGSPEAFEAALARSGMDLPLLRQRLREDLSIRAYLDQRLAAREKREQVIEEWTAGLRRRADIVHYALRSGLLQSPEG